jgi:hypothetical protein
VGHPSQSGAILALLAALLAGAPARAEPTPADRAEADGLFKEAKKLLARGKTPEACARLEASYALDPVGGTLMNLAHCHEILGRTATAWTEFEAARAMARTAGRADREKAAADHLVTLEPRVAHLTVTVPAAAAAPPGLTVSLDDVPLPTSARGRPSPIDPGPHVARASAPGRQPWEMRFTIGEGEARAIEVPRLAGDALPAAPPPPPATAAWPRPLGIGALAAGAALVGVGVGFGVRAMSLGSDARAACGGSVCAPGNPGVSLFQQGNDAANITNGTLIGGAALAAGGAALLIVASRAGERAPVTVAPAVGAGLAAVAARGTW